MVLPEVVERVAEVGARVDVDHVPTLEGQLDGVVDVLLLEERRHLAQLGDEDEGPDLREGLLQGVDELQHEARDVRDGRGDVRQDHQLRPILLALLEDQLEGDPAVGHVSAQGLVQVQLALA